MFKVNNKDTVVNLEHVIVVIGILLESASLIETLMSVLFFEKQN